MINPEVVLPGIYFKKWIFFQFLEFNFAGTK